jgi:hypothetical protein
MYINFGVLKYYIVSIENMEVGWVCGEIDARTIP